MDVYYFGEGVPTPKGLEFLFGSPSNVEAKPTILDFRCIRSGPNDVYNEFPPDDRDCPLV
jgi:hypothetical protein